MFSWIELWSLAVISLLVQALWLGWWSPNGDKNSVYASCYTCAQLTSYSARLAAPMCLPLTTCGGCRGPRFLQSRSACCWIDRVNVCSTSWGRRGVQVVCVECIKARRQFEIESNELRKEGGSSLYVCSTLLHLSPRDLELQVPGARVLQRTAKPSTTMYCK